MTSILFCFLTLEFCSLTPDMYDAMIRLNVPGFAASTAGTFLKYFPIQVAPRNWLFKSLSFMIESTNEETGCVSFSIDERRANTGIDPVEPNVDEEVYVLTGFVTTVNVSKSFLVTLKIDIFYYEHSPELTILG